MKKYKVILQYSGTLIEVFEAETEEEALKKARNELSLDVHIIDEEIKEVE